MLQILRKKYLTSSRGRSKFVCMGSTNERDNMKDITGLSVCIDCGDVIANGWGNFNENYPDDYSESAARREDIEKGLEMSRGGHWVLVDGSDSDFSSKPCDLCRSHFAGARYGAAILFPEAN
jgi:hypothetical protein